MARHSLFVRAALHLQAAYRRRLQHGNGSDPVALRRMSDCHVYVDQLRQPLRLAQERGWSACVIQLRGDLLAQVSLLNTLLQEARARLEEPLAVVPDLRLLTAELAQLDAEFSSLGIDLQGKSVRVTTEPIELEQIALGPFQIELSCARLGQSLGTDCFELLALEPNPAANRDDTPHPHVRDGALCAGEAMAPIHRAHVDIRLANNFMARSFQWKESRSAPAARIGRSGGAWGSESNTGAAEATLKAHSQPTATCPEIKHLNRAELSP